MFIDQVRISVSSGQGGDGMIAFRREKFVPAGGPSGGDGGRGGSVFLEASSHLNTLIDFRDKRKFAAAPGERGRSKNQHGKAGRDLILKVPCGTVVREAAGGQVLADLTVAGQRFLTAPGGRGGRGNARLATPTRRAPHYAEPGEAGVAMDLILELKLLADVGLVGLPNAGKSSLLAAVTAARPKIADYPFTTIEPHLGVVRFPTGDGFVMADIPGLIEGAHRGAGLGHEFLRHIERTRLLLHLVDASAPDPQRDFAIIQQELSSYSRDLADRPQFVVLNKIDRLADRALVETLSNRLATERCPVFVVSARTREGLDKLIEAVRLRLPDLPLPRLHLADLELPLSAPQPSPFTVYLSPGGTFVVESDRLARIVALTRLDNDPALYRLHRILDSWGVSNALRQHGVQDGDTVRIGEVEFTYVE